MLKYADDVSLSTAGCIIIIHHITKAAAETYMVCAVGSRASEEQNLGALSVTILTRKVESCVSCLGIQEGETSVLIRPVLSSKYC